jgi:transposase-like protein
MKPKEFRGLVEQLAELSEVQRDGLVATLKAKGWGENVIMLIEARFAAAPCCGHCKSERIGTWGHAAGLRRYKCRECGRTFNALTGTPLAHLHRRDAWLAYACALVDRDSLRMAANRCSINLTTSFRWRHRFLKASMNARPQTLEGIVEADEMLFPFSYKGSRTLLGRAPRKRGAAQKSGSPGEYAAVLIVRDRHGQTTDVVMPDRESATVKAVLRPVVAHDALLLSDATKVYGTFAREAGIEHVAVVTSDGRRVVEGVYHIRNVNDYVSRLKAWMRSFNGVATKYLPSYLGWRRMIERDGDRLTPRRSIACALA